MGGRVIDSSVNEQRYVPGRLGPWRIYFFTLVPVAYEVWTKAPFTNAMWGQSGAKAA